MKTYFIGSIGSQSNYNQLNWVNIARSKDDTRSSLQCISVKDGFACATDGLRLHAAEIEDIEDGLYNITKTSKEIILKENTEEDFPDIQKAFPDHKDFTLIPLYNGSSLSRKPKPFVIENSLSGCFAKIIRALPEALTVNLSFLKDVLNGEHWKAYVYKNSEVLAFENCNRLALIMPIEINE